METLRGIIKDKKYWQEITENAHKNAQELEDIIKRRRNFRWLNRDYRHEGFLKVAYTAKK